MELEFLTMWSAIRAGAFYSLLALSYLLIVRSTGIFNFAVGAYAMLGAIAYGVATARWSLPISVAIALALALSISAAALTEGLVVQPIVRRSRAEFSAIMAIVALLFVLEQLAGQVFGRRTILAERLVEGTVHIGSSIIHLHDVASITISLMAIVALSTWIHRGVYGRMLRAVGENEHASRMLGIPVRRVRYLAMVLAGLVAGIAGILVAPQAGVTFLSGIHYAIAGFVALVIGGTASTWGPLLGGMFVGTLEVLGARLIGGGSRDYILLVVVFCLFTVRKEGLLTVQVRT